MVGYTSPIGIQGAHISLGFTRGRRDFALRVFCVAHWGKLGHAHDSRRLIHVFPFHLPQRFAYMSQEVEEAQAALSRKSQEVQELTERVEHAEEQLDQTRDELSHVPLIVLVSARVLSECPRTFARGGRALNKDGLEVWRWNEYRRWVRGLMFVGIVALRHRMASSAPRW